MADLKGFQKLQWYYQVLIVSAVCGAMLGGFWYQFLSPIEVDIEAKNKQMAELQAIIEKSLAQQKILGQIKKDALALQIKLDGLKSILPLEKETDQVLRSVQQSASSSELRILRVGFRPIIDHEVYTEWPIDMDVVGTYHNVGKFLGKIRELPRIVNIGSLKVQSKAAEGESAFTASVQANYTATTFVYRDEPLVTEVPAKTAAK
jgi:type IV pilus assembly protein PilO